MLVETVNIRYSYAMASPRKRSPIRPKGIPIFKMREVTSTKSGKEYRSWQIDWRDPETDKRKRKQFQTRPEATRFRGEQEIRTGNVAATVRTVATRLTPGQLIEAEAAYEALGDRGTLAGAVALFLDRAAPPEAPKAITDAIRAFLKDKESEGLRPQSICQLESTCRRFSSFATGQSIVYVHDISTAILEAFLRRIRAKNGGEASRKTWNNTRGELSSWLGWCCDNSRRWIKENPAAAISIRKLDGTAEPEILTVARAARMMRDAETFADGKLARFVALAMFAGIRPGSSKRTPGEMDRLAAQQKPDELINLKTGFITIPADCSKTRKRRQIKIRPALHAWIEATDGHDIKPVNFDRLYKKFRKRHNLAHDELRHTFISMHVAAWRSIGDAALEAGNTERVINEHYLNTVLQSTAEAFWRIAPRGKRIPKANVMPPKVPHLRIVA